MFLSDHFNIWDISVSASVGYLISSPLVTFYSFYMFPVIFYYMLNITLKTEANNIYP